MKKLIYLKCLGANVGIILIIFVAANQEKGLTNFINALFYVTAFYTIIFLYLYIVKGTFFDGIVYSFRHFREVVFPNSNAYEVSKVKALPSENINPHLFHIVKWQFVTMLGSLLVLQAIYFLI